MLVVVVQLVVFILVLVVPGLGSFRGHSVLLCIYRRSAGHGQFTYFISVSYVRLLERRLRGGNRKIFTMSVTDGPEFDVT